MHIRRARTRIVFILVVANFAIAAAPSRSTLRQLLEEGGAGAPEGYTRVGHRDSGYTLGETYSSGNEDLETVMFTAEGGVYTKKVGDNSHLPRRLSEVGSVQTYADPNSASLNPELQCDSCPDTDTRTRVKDTKEVPWSAVGLLARQDANDLSAGISQCSGAIIGAQRRHVITAGHCLVDSGSSSDNVDKITFYPALNGKSLPYGQLGAVRARVLRQYVEERSTTQLALNFDFALITLGQAAPAGTSYMDVAAGRGTETYDLTTAGYPADKNQYTAQYMYEVACPNVRFDYTNGPRVLGCGDQCSNIVVHDCLSYEGQSGSAIWSQDGQNRTVRAILTGALTVGTSSSGTTYNVGTQLNSFVYNTLVGWYNEDVKEGLPMAPPAPPNTVNNPDRITTTLGNSSWWRNHWWYVVLPVGVCLVVGAFFLLLSCCRHQRRKSRPMVGANYPPASGGGYPQQQFQPYSQPQNNAFPTQAYYNQQGAPPQGSNFARYGPSYYNGTGTNGI